MDAGSETVLAPRVLVIMADQWPRALLRAALREVGYDAIGARDLIEALAYPATDPQRGPVRLLILDQPVLQTGDELLLPRLCRRHGEPGVLLLAPGIRPPPKGPWQRVMQRPVTLGQVVEAARALVPLPSAAPGTD
jgi:hypothetical protein